MDQGEDEQDDDDQRNNRDDWNRFKEYRRQHPGPLSTKAFTFWRKNGEKDVQGFIWKAKKTPSKKEALRRKEQSRRDKENNKKKKTEKEGKKRDVGPTINVYGGTINMNFGDQ